MTRLYGMWGKRQPSCSNASRSIRRRAPEPGALEQGIRDWSLPHTVWLYPERDKTSKINQVAQYVFATTTLTNTESGFIYILLGSNFIGRVIYEVRRTIGALWRAKKIKK